MLTMAVAAEAGTLDIHTLTNATTRTYARALYNTLTNVDIKGNVVPELALSWSSPDPKVWEFKLRPGVKFHDGTAVDAEAIKFSMERVMDPATKSALVADLVPGVASISAVDPLTVRFTMAEADVTLPARLSTRSGFIVSPAGVKKHGIDFGKTPVGSGPFQFVEWFSGDHLTLKRFDGYWDKDASGGALPYLDGLTFRPIANTTAMLTALRTGQVDLIDTVLPSDLAQVKTDAKLTAAEGPGAIFVAWLNNGKPPFDKKALRQAVNWAIDREAIHKALYFGTGSPGKYIIDEQSWGFDPAAKFYTRDLAKAKAALAEGGQPNGFTFDWVTYSIPLHVQIAQAVKGQLAEVGIEVNIVALENSTAIARRTSGDYHAGTAATSPNPDPDATLTPNLNTVRSQMRYGNTAVDDLLAKARATAQQQERQRYYHQIQQTVMEDAPFIAIHQDADIKVMGAGVQGFGPTIETFLGGTAKLWIKR
jgi:peptide/nickel transport system substrate-binding protein